MVTVESRHGREIAFDIASNAYVCGALSSPSLEGIRRAIDADAGILRLRPRFAPAAGGPIVLALSQGIYHPMRVVDSRRDLRLLLSYPHERPRVSAVEEYDPRGMVEPMPGSGRKPLSASAARKAGGAYGATVLPEAHPAFERALSEARARHSRLHALAGPTSMEVQLLSGSRLAVGDAIASLPPYEGHGVGRGGPFIKGFGVTARRLDDGRWEVQGHFPGPIDKKNPITTTAMAVAVMAAVAARSGIRPIGAVTGLGVETQVIRIGGEPILTASDFLPYAAALISGGDPHEALQRPIVRGRMETADGGTHPSHELHRPSAAVLAATRAIGRRRAEADAAKVEYLGLADDAPVMTFAERDALIASLPEAARDATGQDGQTDYRRRLRR